MEDEKNYAVNGEPVSTVTAETEEGGSMVFVNGELVKETAPPDHTEASAAAALAADKERYGSLTEAEIEVQDEKAREVFKAQMPELLAAKKREYETDGAGGGDPRPGSGEAKEAIRDAIRQGH